MANPWKRYRKIALTEMIPWSVIYPMNRVQVSPEDRDQGSPQTGDMIARQPDNHEDQWLIRAEVFKATYVEVEDE